MIAFEKKKKRETPIFFVSLSVKTNLIVYRISEKE